MKDINLKQSGLNELSLDDKQRIYGGVVWKIMAVTSASIYIYDHWECIKAGIRHELAK